MVGSRKSLLLPLLIPPHPSPPPEQLGKPHTKVTKTVASILSLGGIYDILYDIMEECLPLHVQQAFTLHVLNMSFGNV
jgi:hypothetical protein